MSFRPRVLVIPSWYPSDDDPTAGVFVSQQVGALARVADVAVLHVDAGERDLAPRLTMEDGVPVVRAGIAATGLRARYFGYRRAGAAAFETLLAQWALPDLVHVQALFPAALIARDVKRRHGVPYVTTEHSEEYLARSRRRLVRTPGMLPLVLRPLARASSTTIAVSRYLADRLVELSLARDPVVIPNVVPPCTAVAAPARTPRLVAHVSVMGPAKNLDVLLEAVALLRSRRTDFVLRLVGDGECRRSLEGLSMHLGLSDVVRFTGRQTPEEVHRTLSEAAFTVVSSTHETFSVSAAESLMCGRPVVATRCGGPEEFVTPEVGLLVEPDSVEALAEGISWMLDNLHRFDPGHLSGYAAARFAPDVVAGRILDVYRNVLNG